MDKNTLKNKDHYNLLYRRSEVNNIVQKVRNLNLFLDDAIKTDTSWHGMYYDDFKNRISGKRILELGCGDGLNASIMASLGAEVTAIDISDASESIIKQVNSQLGTNIRAMTGDFSSMDFDPKSFDFFVVKAFLHHLNYDLELKYLRKTSVVLKEDGEARFFEPAVNSKFLDTLRWVIPVPGRPSILDKRKYQIWKQNDPHPVRDNSTNHFTKVGDEFFSEVSVYFIGSIERFSRLLPSGKTNRSFRRWAHHIEPSLPGWFRYSAARSQLLIYRNPKL